MCGTTGVDGTSPDALLATCVKYPAAVPKPAPPNTTSRGYSYSAKSYRKQKTLTINHRSAFPEDCRREHSAEKCAYGSMVVRPMRSSLWKNRYIVGQLS
jgi:hypothetical protein